MVVVVEEGREMGGGGEVEMRRTAGKSGPGK